MEEIQQACIWDLQVQMRHSGQGGHRIPPAVHLIPQPAILRRLDPNESTEVADSRHYLEDIALEEGLVSR